MTMGGPDTLPRLGGVLPRVRTCLLFRDSLTMGHMASMPHNFPLGALRALHQMLQPRA